MKSIETPISRIFGGRGRSTLRRPGASDSVTVEGWRHLGLDIQSPDVHTVEDALNELSRPETVQVSSARGALVDGSKQYLLDAVPPILILHLKRFQYDPVLKGVVKQRKVVRFGTELVLPKSMSLFVSQLNLSLLSETPTDICSTMLKSQPAPSYKLYGGAQYSGLVDLVLIWVQFFITTGFMPLVDITLWTFFIQLSNRRLGVKDGGMDGSTSMTNIFPTLRCTISLHNAMPRTGLRTSYFIG